MLGDAGAGDFAVLVGHAYRDPDRAGQDTRLVVECDAADVRAVGEDMQGVGDVVGGRRRGEAVGVFRRNVAVLGGVSEEERRRRRGHQRVQGRRAAHVRRGVLTEPDHP